MTFDPEKLSYDKLLDVFFANHDPTTLNRQGPDVGLQYQQYSAILLSFKPAVDKKVRIGGE